LSQHLATRELYSISKELNMPAETLIEQYNPDLTPAFKEWLVAELRKHYEHEQRSQQAAAQQQQQQSPQLPAAGDTVSPWAGQQHPEEVQPQAQPQQQQQQVAGDVPAAAPAAGGRAGGGGGLEALRARMNQLQAKCTGSSAAPAPAAPISAAAPAPGALVGANSEPALTKSPGLAAAVIEAANAISDGGIGVAPSAESAAAAGGQQQGAGPSIGDLKSRFASVHIAGH
jgi:hypothetical protein